MEKTDSPEGETLSPAFILWAVCRTYPCRNAEYTTG
nr:MAG TPA: hypothetical protein [Caudoviricetes sp.]